MTCIKCDSEILFIEVCQKWAKSSDGYIKHKCKKCGKINGITQMITGELVCYEVNKK